MKKIKTKVYVPIILILIGIAFIANGSWSWTGATAWCLEFDDDWYIAHGSVAWSGMADGSWNTSAQIGDEEQFRSGNVHNSGGGFSHLERQSDPDEFVQSMAKIDGIDNMNIDHEDQDTDSLNNPSKCNLCSGSGCSECD